MLQGMPLEHFSIIIFFINNFHFPCNYILHFVKIYVIMIYMHRNLPIFCAFIIFVEG